jgi:YVTN family beta-propeller protein
VVGTINLPRDNAGLLLKPKGIVVSPDGKRIYVATGRGNCVAVIDSETQKVEQLIAVGQRPWGIALSPDGKVIYTANGLSNDVSVVDVATRQVTATIKAGDGPWGIVIKP